MRFFKINTSPQYDGKNVNKLLERLRSINHQTHRYLHLMNNEGKHNTIKSSLTFNLFVPSSNIYLSYPPHAETHCINTLRHYNNIFSPFYLWLYAYMCTRINRSIQLLCTYTLIEYVFDYTSFITLILL